MTDTTDAVLPGVTVTAQAVATGNTFTAVSDAQGQYRIGAMRPGVYRITAELPGFATVVTGNIELLLGQRAALNYKMVLSSVQESVTVTGEAPLLDTAQSMLGGNIDTRQMSELPVQGRNWMDLTMLAPGSRVNAVGQSDAPAVTSRQAVGSGLFQINLDGQQITVLFGGSSKGGQPKISRDAIGELQFVTSRFDATQGRSNGSQINAVTKAGTNVFAGTVSGYFRSDKFNAADPVLKRVLPYSNQQVGTTFGGPIRKDKVHFFGFYEGEREPQTFAWTSQFTRFNLPDRTEPRTSTTFGARGDMQLSTANRLMVRGNAWNAHSFDILNGATAHPSASTDKDTYSRQLFGTFTQVLSSSRVNEVRAGYIFNRYYALPVVPSFTITLRGYTIGQNAQAPEDDPQHTYSVRDDFTYVHASHEIKLGGEVLYTRLNYAFNPGRPGSIDAQGGAIPANIQDLLPVWNDTSTWNIAALSSITRSVTIGLGEPRRPITIPTFGAWFQDDWRLTSRLVLNLGVRWDLQYGVFRKSDDMPRFYRRGSDDQEWADIAPRLGFVYTLPGGDRTVIRGGFGKYYTGVPGNLVVSHYNNIIDARPTVLNDGRPNFAADPYNISGGGRLPTVQEAQNAPGVLLGGNRIISSDAKTEFSYQTSVGTEHQFTKTLAVQADYIWNAGRHEDAFRQTNLLFNRDTGINLPFTSARAHPELGSVVFQMTDARSNYHALETALTKRYSDHWQGAVTYTLSKFLNDDPLPINTYEGCTQPYSVTLTAPTPVCNVPFTLSPDLGGVYGLAAGDQRHRLVANGIFELPFDFQLSGLYFFGSGQRFPTTYGADVRNSQGTSTRARPDGTIVPRNNFVGEAIHRFDMRVTRQFRFGRRSIEGIAEVFNAFNHGNYGTYVTTEISPSYGHPLSDVNVAYGPRAMQLGFRVAF